MFSCECARKREAAGSGMKCTLMDFYDIEYRCLCKLISECFLLPCACFASYGPHVHNTFNYVPHMYRAPRLLQTRDLKHMLLLPNAISSLMGRL